MKPILFLIVMATTASCATSKQCLSEEEEPVSICRAEQRCGRGSARFFIGGILSGLGSGLTNSRNQAMDSYNFCVRNELEAQKYNAGIEDKSVRCVSTRISDGQIETECH